MTLLTEIKRGLTLLRKLPNVWRDVVDGQVEAQWNQLRSHAKYQQKGHLTPFGYKVYSQADEDGIIAEIFRRIGTTNRYFIEFGAGDGLENNTLALLFQNWTGLWIEGDPKRAAQILAGYANTIARKQLTLLTEYVSRENIDGLLKPHVPHTQIDLLSVDIDGNDIHVFEAIDCVQARVVVMEYNSRFVPPTKYCMRYDASHRWDQSDNMGASLSFLEERMEAHGYRLVGCSLSGVNAFFVDETLVGDLFCAPFSAENHYMPPRHYLRRYRPGHRASLATLDNRVTSSN